MCESGKAPTMWQWLTKLNTSTDVIARVGIIGTVFAAIIKYIITDVKPTSNLNCIVSVAVALMILLSIVLGPDPKTPTLKWMSGAIGIAYVLTALLYLLNHNYLVLSGTSVIGYDAITELASTACFVFAWFRLSKLDANKQHRSGEHCTQVVVSLCILAFGVAKLLLDTQKIAHELNSSIAGPSTLDLESGRLAVNICNGAIFLSFYMLMRKLLLPASPMFHVVLLLFGCMQIAAHGRDEQYLTAPSQVSVLASLWIAWTLVIGKIVFGMYICYVYFNAEINLTEPAARTSNAPEYY